MLEYRKPELFVLGDAACLIQGSKSDPVHKETDGRQAKIADTGLDD